MSLIEKSAWAVLLVGCVGCAHMPDVTVGYYLAQSRVAFKVTRTAACDTAGNVIVINAATPVVTHFADPAQFVKLPLKPLRGIFSDTDAKFDFYDDGRLKGVNATTSGQGELILRTVVNIGTVLAGMAAAPRAPAETDCQLVTRIGGGQPITLVHEGEVKFGVKGAQRILPDVASAVKAVLLAKAIGTVCATMLSTEETPVPVVKGVEAYDVQLKVRQPGLASINVSAGGQDGCADPIWEGKLAVGQAGKEYFLPMPSATVFGKQSLVAAFHESGALTSVQFVSNTGAGQALNVLNSALTAIQDEATRKANELNAEASLIAAQQRLAKCRADPKACS